jgi:hypothetical protein
MADFKEQCICIRLFFYIDKIGAETFQVLTFAFKKEAVRQTAVFDCSAGSRNGMTSVKDVQDACLLAEGTEMWNIFMGFGVKILLSTSLANELGSVLVYVVKF